MSLDLTRPAKDRRPLTKPQKWVLGLMLAVMALVFYLLSAVTIVINGTTSLPHTAYVMVTWPKIIRPGIYAAFEAPMEIAGAFDNLAFVKRVVGMSGDEVRGGSTRVCVNHVCRDLQPAMIEAGYGPLPSQAIPPETVVVFGDTTDSLDSRYGAIGTIAESDVLAVGYPIRLPHWKELGSWLGTF